jgi:2-polyprenyl-3-methyl-5-hydroxy-6-metoxy-1,4-benzoquinol methylase
MSSEPNRDAADAHEAQVGGVEEWFGARSQQWRDSYENVRRVNDLVLIDRKNITLDYVSTHVPAGGLVLDAGCGAGWIALDLVRRGYRVHGVDVAQEMIDQSERLFAEAGVPRDRYEFTRADLLHADLEPGSFDAVVALGLLQYQVEQEPLLRALHTALRPGGLFVVTGPIRRGLPNYLGVAELGGKLLRRVGVLPPMDTTGKTQHRYSLPGLLQLLRSCGFEIVDATGHGYGDWVVLGRVLRFRGELLLHRLLGRVAKVLPIGRWANDLVVAARVPE